MKRQAILVLAILLVASLVPVCKAVPLELVRQSESPVLDTGGPSPYESYHVGNSCVLVENGVYKIWYTGYRAGPAPRQAICYATSMDKGLTWTKHGTVLEVTEAWEHPAQSYAGIHTPTVIHENGKYKMWYNTNDYKVGYVTSIDGIHWDPIDKVQQLPEGYAYPHVVKGPSDYKMYYDKPGTPGICCMESIDGCAWEIANEGNPVLVLGAPGEWDSSGVSQSRVRYDPETSKFEMWYAGDSTTSAPCIGFALSDDGLTWEKDITNPFLEPVPGTWESGAVIPRSVVFDLSDRMYRMFYGGYHFDHWAIGLAAAAPEPPCGWIAFQSNIDGDLDIWAVRADGTELRQLTNQPGGQQYLQWSPNSTKIAYSSDNDAQIWVYDWSSGNSTKIYDADDYGGALNAYQPAWSPNGSKILFREDSSSNNPHITVINADGTGRQVVPVQSGYVSSPSWSPSGTAFVYDRRNSGLSYTNDLWIYDFTATGDIMNGINHRLTQGASSESTTKRLPDWAPNERIVFSWGHNLAVINPGESGNWGDPTNPDVIFLTDDASWPSKIYQYASWSPDLSQIVYLYESDGQASLWIMDAFPGGSRYSLTDSSSYSKESPDWGNPPPEPAEPNIHVSPTIYDFGDVAIGSAETMLVSITNTGDADLTVTSLDFQAGSSSDFSITSAPALPATVPPAATVDVEITFSPSILYLSSATLEIGSDDADESLVEVSLSGVGVWIEPPPDEQIEEILDFIDDSVEDGNLAGDGPGNSADKRLNALINMIEAAGDLIKDGLYDQAHQQLEDAYKKCDGQTPPPDFVSGPAAQELADRIQELMQIIRGAVIVTVDGLSFVNTLLGLNLDDTEHYLKTAVEAMNVSAITDSDVNSFTWPGDAGDTDTEVLRLREHLRNAYAAARDENKKFVVIGHSWGTFLAYCALSDLSIGEDPIQCDLFIMLSSPLGVEYAHTPPMFGEEELVYEYTSYWRDRLAADVAHHWIGSPNAIKLYNFWVWGDPISGPLHNLLPDTIDKQVDYGCPREEVFRSWITCLIWHEFTKLQPNHPNNESLRNAVEDLIMQTLSE